MKITTIFFDLDGTLYPHNNGVWGAIAENMDRYIVDNFGINEDKVAKLKQDYFIEYGTTLRGLQKNFEVDTLDYLAHVHDIPLEKYLKPNSKLNDILTQLPQKKWILTNSDYPHSERVLNQLGIKQHFEGIIDVWTTKFLPKPDPFAFNKALEIAGHLNSSDCLFVDDIPKNIEGAKTLGFKTVLVSNIKTEVSPDFQISQIHDLLIEIPELATNN
ncbi:MAG: pyrimidine 5'-nucleotidase [Chloroflexi bacterium]|nr:pyrimidine 5'-nucleotidase [Chloroflexota bacterium]